MFYHVLLLKSRQVQVKSNHTVQLAQLTCEVGWEPNALNYSYPCWQLMQSVHLSHKRNSTTFTFYIQRHLAVNAQLSMMSVISSDKVKDDGVPTKIDFDSEEILEVLMTGAQ